MPTARIFVEDCTVISTSQFNFEVPRSDEFPWKSVPVTFTESCPNCGSSVPLRFKAVRTRQGKRFLCPRCGRPVQNVYRPPQAMATDWRCKECHNLVYSSQYRKKPDASPFGLLGFQGLKV